MRDLVFYNPTENFIEKQQQIQMMQDIKFNSPEENVIESIVAKTKEIFACFTPKLIMRFKDKNEAVDFLYKAGQNWSRKEVKAYCKQLFFVNDGEPYLIDKSEFANITQEDIDKLEGEINLLENDKKTGQIITLKTKLYWMKKVFNEKTTSFMHQPTKQIKPPREFFDTDLIQVLKNIQASEDKRSYLYSKCFIKADLNPYNFIDWDNIDVLAKFNPEKIKPIYEQIDKCFTDSKDYTKEFFERKKTNYEPLFSQYSKILYKTFKKIYNKHTYQKANGFANDIASINKMDVIASINKMDVIEWKIGEGQFSLFALWMAKESVNDEWNLDVLIQSIKEWDSKGIILMENLSKMHALLK